MSDAASSSSSAANVRSASAVEAEPAMDDAYEQLAGLARRLLRAPVAAIVFPGPAGHSISTTAEAWSTAQEALQHGLARALCGHVLATGRALEVADVRAHELTREQVAAQQPSFLSFLGCPLTTHEGVAGCLCVLDTATHAWSEDDRAGLAQLAQLTGDQIELRRARDRQQEMSSRLTKLTAQVPGVLYQFLLRPDGTSCFPYASQGIRAIYGVDPEEVAADASKVFSALHPEDFDGIVASIAESARTLQNWSYEYRVRLPDGSVQWLRGDSAPERLADGSILWHGMIKNISERKEQDLLLRRALREVQLRQTAFDEHAIVAITDTNGVITYANAKLCEITGYTQAELVGSNNRILKSGVHPPEHYAGLWAKLDRGESWQGEFCNRRKDGSHYWVASTIVPVNDESGRRERYIAVQTDITAQKETLATLSRVRALEEAIINSTTYLVIATDTRGVVVSINDAAAQALGYSAEELIGRQTPALWHDPAELQARSQAISAEFGETIEPGFETFVHRARRTGAADEQEWTFVRRDGSRFPVMLSVTCLRDDAGEIFGYLGVVKDITAQRQQEAALRESEARFRQTFEHAGIGQAILTIDGHWRQANQALLQMLGYSLEELRQFTFQDLTHPEDQHIGRDIAPQLVSGEIPVLRATKRYRRADGRYVWCHLTAVVIRDAQGRPIERISQLEDITAAREAAEEKAALDKKLAETAKLESLGVLAGGIAHDFNNILTGVLGHASLLRLELPAGSPHLRAIQQIEQSSRRAADLCRQMLAYSGKGRFVIRAVDLNLIVSETTRLLEISISKNAALHYHLASQLPAIEADETQIRQVVMNLVINASEAIGDRPGAVAIATGVTHLEPDGITELQFGHTLPRGDYVWLEVSDNGCGMAPEVVAKIFDPFFTTKFTGRGLGLAAVQGIVRGHHGAIKVYSEPGKGTTFRLLFPAARDSAALSPPLESGAAPTRRARGTALVIDDEETVRTVASRILEYAGFAVETAPDGAVGVERFSCDPHRYSLVLLDLTMPHLDGEETFRRLRHVRPSVPVVLMSGFNHQEVITRFAGKGLAGFVPKPIDSDELIRLACSVTEAPRTPGVQ